MIALLDVQRLLARLRFRHLQLLDALAEHGSMRRAAIALHLTQPALSKALHELEDILGLVLYERSPSGLVCTRAGQVLVRGARLLIEDIKQIALDGRSAGTEPRLRLRLGAPPFIAMTVVPALLAQLARSGHTLSVQLREDRVPALVDALRAGQVDLLLTTYEPGAFELPDARLVSEPLFEEQLVVIAAAAEPLTRRRRVPWTELADRAWVLPPEPSFVRRAVAERFAASGLHPATPAVESASVSTNVALVAAGIGLGAVPRVVMLEAGRLGKLRRVRVDPPPAMPAVRLVHLARASLRHTFALVRQTIVQVLPAAGYASPE